MISSEELRVAALAKAAKRGKWVARRRIFRRWLAWVLWSLVLPTIGLATVVVALCGLVFWQYLGHDAAYAAAQTWVQQEFGTFTASSSADNVPHPTVTTHPAVTTSSNPSMIHLTDEATPDLQIDRHLSLKKAASN